MYTIYHLLPKSYQNRVHIVFCGNVYDIIPLITEDISDQSPYGILWQCVWYHTTYYRRHIRKLYRVIGTLMAKPLLTATGNAHYSDVIINAMTSQITSPTTICSIVYTGADQGKHQSSASLAFVWPVTGEFPAQKAINAENFPFDDVTMNSKIRIECE